MRQLEGYEGGYWGYMNEDVRQSISYAVDSIAQGTYFQLLDDGFNTVAVASLEVGVQGMGVLGNVNLSNLPVYADNTAASSLSNGTLYRTATGDVKVKY